MCYLNLSVKCVSGYAKAGLYFYMYVYSDVEKIQTGIGDKLVFFISSLSPFLAGFVIAFYLSWKMALVMCIMLPVLVFISAVITKVTTISLSSTFPFSFPILFRQFPSLCMLLSSLRL